MRDKLFVWMVGTFDRLSRWAGRMATKKANTTHALRLLPKTEPGLRFSCDDCGRTGGVSVDTSVSLAARSFDAILEKRN